MFKKQLQIEAKMNQKLRFVSFLCRKAQNFLKLPFIPDLPHFPKSTKFLETTIYFLDHLF